METFIIVAGTVMLAGFCVLIVYLVGTLIQIKRTAEEIEQTSRRINRQLENLESIGTRLSSVGGAVSPVAAMLTSAIPGFVGWLLKAVFRWRK